MKKLLITVLMATQFIAEAMHVDQNPLIKRSRAAFSADEDTQLRELVGRLGTNSWGEVANLMSGRNPRQVKERWKHYLSNQNSTKFTPEEDRVILIKVMEYGRKWTKISSFLKNRSDLAVRNRFFQLTFRNPALANLKNISVKPKTPKYIADDSEANLKNTPVRPETPNYIVDDSEYSLNFQNEFYDNYFYRD
ncbi:MAG: hypothetical protein LBO02_02455 [Holosporaceae bacterium]|jgi:hypothetical protein|nr:hypothetical protein [Holosporaceae bacterium]